MCVVWWLDCIYTNQGALWVTRSSTSCVLYYPNGYYDVTSRYAVTVRFQIILKDIE